MKQKKGLHQIERMETDCRKILEELSEYIRCPFLILTTRAFVMKTYNLVDLFLFSSILWLLDASFLDACQLWSLQIGGFQFCLRFCIIGSIASYDKALVGEKDFISFNASFFPSFPFLPFSPFPLIQTKVSVNSSSMKCEVSFGFRLNSCFRICEFQIE